MTIIERTVTRLTAGLPTVLRVGFAVLAAGLALDLGFHLFVGATGHGAQHQGEGLGWAASLIHLVVFAGMGLSLVGVVSSAVHHPTQGQPRSSPQERSTS
jgi:hypothetical protein